MTYEHFTKVGRLGCASCYDTFKGHLNPLLKATSWWTYRTLWKNSGTNGRKYPLKERIR